MDWGHDAVVSTPMLGRITTRMGIVRASHDNANALFQAGRKVMVFPGGNREAFRPLQRPAQNRFWRPAWVYQTGP